MKTIPLFAIEFGDPGTRQVTLGGARRSSAKKTTKKRSAKKSSRKKR